MYPSVWKQSPLRLSLLEGAHLSTLHPAAETATIVYAESFIQEILRLTSGGVEKTYWSLLERIGGDSITEFEVMCNFDFYDGGNTLYVVGLEVSAREKGFRILVRRETEYVVKRPFLASNWVTKAYIAAGKM